MRNLFGDNVYVALPFLDLLTDPEYKAVLPTNYLPETITSDNRLFVCPSTIHTAYPVGQTIARWIFLDAQGRSMHDDMRNYFEYPPNVKYILKLSSTYPGSADSIVFDYFVDANQVTFSREMVTNAKNEVEMNILFSSDSSIAIVQGLEMNTPAFYTRFFE